MNSTVLEQARNFISLVQSSGTIVSTASIYGSYARGQANSHSDIDICVVSPEFGKDYISEMVKLRNISVNINPKIEPIPLNPADLEDKYSSLISEINKHQYKIV